MFYNSLLKYLCIETLCNKENNLLLHYISTINYYNIIYYIMKNRKSKLLNADLKFKIAFDIIFARLLFSDCKYFMVSVSFQDFPIFIK